MSTVVQRQHCKYRNGAYWYNWVLLKRFFTFYHMALFARAEYVAVASMLTDMGANNGGTRARVPDIWNGDANVNCPSP